MSSHVVFRPGHPGFFCMHCEDASELKGDSVSVAVEDFVQQSWEFHNAHEMCEAPTKRELAMRAELFGLRLRAPAAEGRSARYRAALESILKVGFDNPASGLMTTIARDALAAEWSGPCVHGRDPYDRCDECGDLERAAAWSLANRGAA